MQIRKKRVRIEERRDQPYSREGKDRPFDLFYPEGEFEPLKKPLIIVIHEGAFILGDKDQYFVQKMCRSLARKGYATAAVNYSKIQNRIQWIKPSIVDAILDVEGVTRYIQDEFGFLPENTYIVGYSAGAIIANHLAISQASELAKYADEPAVARAFRDKKFAGVVSISGGLLDFNHIDDSDLDNIRLLMIHGTNDQMVPFTRGRTMDREVKEDIKVRPPITWEVDISLIGPISPELVIPAQTLTALRNVLVSDEVCGPNCIISELCGNPNLSVLAVRKGPHNLFYNDEKGTLNQTYSKIINKIDVFVSERGSTSRSSRRDRR